MIQELGSIPAYELGNKGSWELGRWLHDPNLVFGAYSPNMKDFSGYYVSAFRAHDGRYYCVDRLRSTLNMVVGDGPNALTQPISLPGHFKVYSAVVSGEWVLILSHDGCSLARCRLSFGQIRDWTLYTFRQGQEVVAVGGTDDGRIACAFAKIDKVCVFDSDLNVLRDVHWAGSRGVRCLHFCNDGSILATDYEGHRILRWDPTSGTVNTIYGRSEDPGYENGRLNSPTCAIESSYGSVVICDSRNNRIIEIDERRRVLRQIGTPHKCGSRDGLLRQPESVFALPDGTWLVAESKNRRISRLKSTGVTEAILGCPDMVDNWISLPRGAHCSKGGNIAFVDCYNNRVVICSTRGRIFWIGPRQETGQRVSWPRHAVVVDDGVWIADGKGNRIVKFGFDSQPTVIIDRQILGVRLTDPHHFEILGDDRMLITSTGTGEVIEIDKDGNVIWQVAGLSDPHGATRIPSGNTVVCDTGNDRLLEFDASGRLARELSQVEDSAGTWGRLSGPRSVRLVGVDSYLISDTGNHRVLVVSQNGRILWECSPSNPREIGYLISPRYADIDVARNTIVVSDFGNHRVVGIAVDLQSIIS